LKKASQRLDVIVVGAGAAGLMASRELTRAGKSVLVLEASNRVGGRILTHMVAPGIPVELGAEFIHGDAPETTRLVNEARLITVPVMGGHYGSEKGRLMDLGPVWNRIERVFRYLKPDRKEDRSFQELLDGEPGGPSLRKERELARGFIRGFYGADTTLISEKSLAQAGNPAEGAAEARRIVSGYGSLIEYLHRDVADRVRINATVTDIVKEENGVKVSDRSGRTYRARAVILTVPLPMLQDDSISLEPDAKPLRLAARNLEMGHATHVTFTIRERFWEKQANDLSFVQTPTRPFNVWWSQHPLRAPLITGWAGGPPSLQLSARKDIENVAIVEMGRVFGMRRKTVESLVDSFHYHDWSRDRYIRGAYSYAGIGGVNAARVLARPIDNRIFPAGEATDSGSGASVEGALASGKRAARKVLDVLSNSNQ
jgi:monoamine oxidase